MKKVRVTVTGGAGQICYSLLFRIASGEVFGVDTMIDLIVLEREEAMSAMRGVEMELLDCAYPLLSSVQATSSIDEAFDGVDYAFLVGAKPRSKGMERSDLLLENAKIFQEQGRALNRSKNAKVLVVGNPCNTNALIVKHNAKDIDPLNIRAMSRLDQNRAQSLIAIKADVEVSEVSNVGIFGNHSAKMVTDYVNAKISGKAAIDVIQDLDFFQIELFDKVAKRGAEILEVRGKSSAASAANAAIDAMKDWVNPTGHYSAGIYSDGSFYGIAEDLYFSFPMRGQSVIEGLLFDDFLEKKIRVSEKELIDERDVVKKFLVK